MYKKPKLIRVIIPEMLKLKYDPRYKRYILVGIIVLAAIGFFWWQRHTFDMQVHQAPRQIQKTVQEEINAIMNAPGNQPASTTPQQQKKNQKEITTIMNAKGNKPVSQTPAQQQATQLEIERIMNAPGNQSR